MCKRSQAVRPCALRGIAGKPDAACLLTWNLPCTHVVPVVPAGRGVPAVQGLLRSAGELGHRHRTAASAAGVRPRAAARCGGQGVCGAGQAGCRWLLSLLLRHRHALPLTLASRACATCNIHWPPLSIPLGAAPLLVREQLRQEGSRHRYQWQPPATQEGFWNMVRRLLARTGRAGVACRCS